jgi:hypothetical protein
MAINGLQRTLDRLRIVLAPELPDEHLLKQFISSRDEVAFAALVRRHGKMDLGVSRHILRNLHDSEDVKPKDFWLSFPSGASDLQRVLFTNEGRTGKAGLLSVSR